VIGVPGGSIQVRKRIVYIDGVALERRPLSEEELNGSQSGGIGEPGHPVRGERLEAFRETSPDGRSYVIWQKRGSEDDLPNNTQEYLVPPGHYFMMGDNRDDSIDSRVLAAVGYVPAQNLIGRAEFLFFSTDHRAELWEIHRWPESIRFSRFLKKIQ